jgi:hypothetical protein
VTSRLILGSIAGAALVAPLVFAACARRDSPADSYRDGSPFAAMRPPAPSNLVPPTRKLLETCKQVCNQSATLSCANAAGCISNCLAYGSANACTDEIASFFECLAKQPSPNWECGPDGVAAIRAGFCEDEKTKASSCLKEKTRRPDEPKRKAPSQ